MKCSDEYASWYNGYWYGLWLTILFYAQVKSPPKAGAFKERPAKPTSFRKFYDRGDFPIALEHDTKGNKIAWKVCVSVKYNMHPAKNDALGMKQ